MDIVREEVNVEHKDMIYRLEKIKKVLVIMIRVCIVATLIVLGPALYTFVRDIWFPFVRDTLLPFMRNLF